MDQLELELEARKLDLAQKKLDATIEMEKEKIQLRKIQLDKLIAPPMTEPKGSPWGSTSGLAVIGGVLTLLAAIFGNLIQGSYSTLSHKEEAKAQMALERHKFQSDLIQKAIERAEDTDAAAINLNFLWKAGLISDYDKIPGVLKRADQKEGGFSLPSRQTFGEAADNRILIEKTTKFPYSAVCKLKITASRWNLVRGYRLHGVTSRCNHGSLHSLHA